MFLFKIFLVQIILFIVLLFSALYFLKYGWVYTILLVIFLISNSVITIKLINEFQDTEGNYTGSDVGSFLGSAVEGWMGNLTGHGLFQKAGESMGSIFDEDALDYSAARRRIYIESTLTYLIIIVFYYFFA
ncbi:MAG: hypothetical protein KAI79_09175 [Bacteroidales bacterium]|nr:hypothetical protein [Bacteroidales bacterium]